MERPAPEPVSVLIVKHGALGDVVRTAFLLPGLHEKFEGAVSIDWLTSRGSADLLRFNPYIDRILVHGTECKDRYDWVISLDDERDAVEMASRPTAGKRSGVFLNESRVEYTADFSRWFDMGLLSRFGKERADRMKIENRASHAEIFCEALGVRVSKPTFFNSEMIEARWSRQLNAGLPEGARLIGINAGAGGRWPSKQIPIQTVPELCDRLFSEFAIDRVVLLGDPGSLPLGHEALERNDVCVPDTSSSVLEVAAAIRALDYLITTDSLALHLAVAQGVPTLSVYAPTSAAEIETFGTGVKLASSRPDYCSYRAEADNSEFTAQRMLDLLRIHWQEIEPA